MNFKKRFLKIFLLSFSLIIILQLSTFTRLNWYGCGKENLPPKIISLIVTETETVPRGIIGITIESDDSNIPEGDKVEVIATANGGEITKNQNHYVIWIAPEKEGVYTIEIYAKDLKGLQSDKKIIPITVSNKIRRKFKVVGILNRGRVYSSSCFLGNNSVIVMGGFTSIPVAFSDAEFISQAEIFDLTTSTPIDIDSLKTIKNFTNIIKLTDNRIFIIGKDSNQNIRVEIFDPQISSFNVMIAMPITIKEVKYIFLLKDGNVFLSDGGNIEIYNTVNNLFNFKGTIPLVDHMQILNDDRILITQDDGSAEIYDISTNSAKKVGTMIIPRKNYFSEILPDGRIIVVGGVDKDGNIIRESEIFDPATESFSKTGMTTNMYYYPYGCINKLPNGYPIIIGNSGAEVFDLLNGIFEKAGTIGINRIGYSCAMSNDGILLVIGGFEFEPLSNILMYVE